jgi:protein-S-isoprenylcysteine O-methyltransferase Ste14
LIIGKRGSTLHFLRFVNPHHPPHEERPGASQTAFERRTAIVAGDALTALCFYITFLAYKENPFTSATIELAQDQQVVSTGPYAIVRHPMYAGGSLLFIGTPLALGSYWGLVALGATLPALIWRLLDEERFLTESLPGYADYCREVRWRLIPGS